AQFSDQQGAPLCQAGGLSATLAGQQLQHQVVERALSPRCRPNLGVDVGQIHEAPAIGHALGPGVAPEYLASLGVGEAQVRVGVVAVGAAIDDVQQVVCAQQARP